MSDRPTGTDGSDHVYRERVEKAYAALASSRKWGGRYLFILFFPMFMRTLWYTMVASLVGLSTNYPAMLMAGLHVASLITFYLARPGSPKEKFFLVKVCSSLNIFVLAMIAVNAYRYHVLSNVEVHVSHRLFMKMEEQLGVNGELAEFLAVASDFIAMVLAKVDVWLDGVCFLFGCLAMSNLHTYVTVQIGLNQKSVALAKAADDAKRAQAEKSQPVGKMNLPQGAGKRRSARA